MGIGPIIDAAAILLVAVMMLTSYRKGFVRSVLELIGYIVAAVVARVLCVPVGSWLYTGFFRSGAQQMVTDYLSSAAQGAGGGFDALLSQYQIPASALPAAAAQGTLPTGQFSAALMSGVVDPIGLSVGRGIAFFVIFFLTLWIVRLVASATQVFNRIPLLGAVNRMLGAAVGVAKAALLLFVLAAAVSVVLPLTVYSGQAGAVESALSRSAVYRFLDSINPLKDVLLKG